MILLMVWEIETHLSPAMLVRHARKLLSDTYETFRFCLGWHDLSITFTVNTKIQTARSPVGGESDSGKC